MASGCVKSCSGDCHNNSCSTKCYNVSCTGNCSGTGCSTMCESSNCDIDVNQDVMIYVNINALILNLLILLDLLGLLVI